MVFSTDIREPLRVKVEINTNFISHVIEEYFCSQNTFFDLDPDHAGVLKLTKILEYKLEQEIFKTNNLCELIHENMFDISWKLDNPPRRERVARRAFCD
jgi:hypothetical protein